jgi:hypothetical protein
MTVSILVVDDEADVAELFRQRFRREVRQGTYAIHSANFGRSDDVGEYLGCCGQASPLSDHDRA